MSRTLLLEPDGRLVTLADTATWLGREILISRALCAFERFERPGIHGSQLVRAAELHARTAGPFPDSGRLVLRRRGHCAIWWWDNDKVRTILGRQEHAQVTPETLRQPPGQGFRVVRLRQGFEAQYWNDDFLLGSQWRRTPFTMEAWQAFVRYCGGEDRDAELPHPVTVPVVRGRLSDGWVLRADQMLPLAAASVGISLLAVSAYEVGQGLRLEKLAAALERRAVTVRRSIPANSPVADELRARILANREVVGRPNGMVALDRAVRLLNEAGVKPVAIQLEGQDLTVSLPYEDLDAAGDLALKLERYGGFSSVKPIADRHDNTIQLHMTFGPVRPTAASVQP